MAELDGMRLAVDSGGRPRTDDGGRLVYVQPDTEASTEAEPVEALAPGQAVHTTEDIPPEDLHPENTQPVPPKDGLP